MSRYLPATNRPNISLIGIAVVLTSSALLSGCITSRAYVDPQYRHASYSDLKRVEPPYALSMHIDFQVNGQDRPAANPGLQAQVERSFRASGVVVPYDGKSTAEGDVSIIVNDVADMKSAAAKGFGTGLTWGLVGSHVSDNYEITVTFTQPNGSSTHTYQHSIMTTVGHASGPAGVAAVSRATAVGQVTDDVTLNFLKDMQASGKLLPRITHN